MGTVFNRENLSRLLLELVVVFIGVFAAFWLAGLAEENSREERRREVYNAVVEDLKQFHAAGNTANPIGFINRFRQDREAMDSTLASRSLPALGITYGDYWKIEIVDAFVTGGTLSDIDVMTLKEIVRFHTVHKNFLHLIEQKNSFYRDFITANHDKGMNEFFEAGSGKLKAKYRVILWFTDEQIRFAELLVQMAEKLAGDIEQRHLR